jgi:hypothetical protein
MNTVRLTNTVIEMSATVIPIKDSYHYYHKGVKSRPSWAYDDARKQIASKWANFMKAMPDTANVIVQDVVYEGLGGSIARIGVFSGDLSVTGAGSKTKNPTFGARSWETWFDIQYELQLVFLPSKEAKGVGKGLSIEEVNRRIGAAEVT